MVFLIFKARDRSDLKVLVSYMEDDTRPATVIDIGHPWAESPTSIGSIATMYTSILFMRENITDDDDYIKQEELL
jgi:hypothetical protein